MPQRPAPEPLATFEPLESHRFRGWGGAFHGELARIDVDGDGVVHGLRVGNLRLRREQSDARE